MRRAPIAFVLALALVPLLSGCGDDEAPTVPQGTLDLTFTGDDSFQGAHGGQSIHVGLKHRATGQLVASDQGTVSSSANPSFEFTFPNALAEGESYDLEYWIDSNFNGGTEGSCDGPETDHQWRISVGPASQDVTVADTHRPTETEDICAGTSGDPGY